MKAIVTTQLDTLASLAPNAYRTAISDAGLFIGRCTIENFACILPHERCPSLYHWEEASTTKMVTRAALLDRIAHLQMELSTAIGELDVLESPVDTDDEVDAQDLRDENEEWESHQDCPADLGHDWSLWQE